MPEEGKKTYLEFAQSIKKKYPEYKDVDDHELANKMVQKYPEYADQVDLTPTQVKKKLEPNIQLPSPSESGTLESETGNLEQPNPQVYQGQPLPPTMKLGPDGIPVISNTAQPTNIQQQPLKAATSPLEITAADQKNKLAGKDLRKKEIAWREKNSMTGGRVDELGDSFARGVVGLSSSIMKTPAFLYDVGSAMSNAVGIKSPTAGDIDKEYLKKIPADLYDALSPAEALDGALKNSRAEFEQKYDKDVSEYFAKGDYENGFMKMANIISENAPTTIALMAGNAAGLSGIGSTAIGTGVFGAQKKSEMDEDPATANLSNEEKVVTALANGFAEGLFEQIGVTKLGGVMGAMLKGKTKEQAAKIAKESFVKVYGKVAARFLGTAAEESLGEAATQFAQNAADKYIGGHPELDLSKGVKDAFIIGLGSAGAFGTPVAALDIAQTSAARKKAKDILSQKQVLETEIQSPEISDAAKQTMSNKLKDLNEEEAELAAKEKAKNINIPEDKKTEVQTISDKITKTEEALQDTKISDQARELMEKDVEADGKKIDAIYEESASQKQKAQEEQKKQETQDIADEIEYLKGIQESGIELDKDESSRLQSLEKGVMPESPKEEPPAAEKKVDAETVKTIEQKIKDAKQEYFNLKPETKAEDQKNYIEYRKKNEALEKELEAAQNPVEEAVVVEKPVAKEVIQQEEVQKSADAIKEVAVEKPAVEEVAAEVVNAPVEEIKQVEEKIISEDKKPSEKPIIKTPKTKPNAEETDQAENKDQKANVLKPELIDEEEVADSEKTEDAPTLQKMDDDLTVMKNGFKDKTAKEQKELAEKKFIKMIERAWKAKEAGKIKKTTYTAFRNKASDVLGGKLNLDKEETKFKVTSKLEALKKALLGEGYTKILLSSAGPITPKTVADLIDLTGKIINRGIDAGFTIAESVSKAMAAIKKHPTYKKLLKSGDFVEKEFEKVINDNIVEKKVEAPKTEEKPVAEKKKPTEKKEPSKEGDLSGEERERATTERIHGNERFKDVASYVDPSLDVYDSVSQDKAIKYINKKLDEFEAEGLLYDLAAEVNSGKSVFPESVSLMVPVMLADRLNSMAEQTDNEMQKNVLHKLAAETVDKWRQKVTSIAQQLGLTNFINQYMPKSKAGQKARVESELNDALDSFTSKDDKSKIAGLQNDLSGINNDELADKVKDMVRGELDRIAESLKGKDWVKESNSDIDELLIDLTDC